MGNEVGNGNGKVLGRVSNECGILLGKHKKKMGKGNDRKWQINNNKENWVCPFPFPLIITPNQTAPKRGYFENDY